MFEIQVEFEVLKNKNYGQSVLHDEWQEISMYFGNENYLSCIPDKKISFPLIDIQ